VPAALRSVALAALLPALVLAACAAPPRLAPGLAADADELLACMRRARSVDVPPLPTRFAMNLDLRELCHGTVVAVDGPMLAVALRNRELAPPQRLWCVLPVTPPSAEAIAGDAVVVAECEGLLVCRYVDRMPFDETPIVLGSEAWIDEATTRAYARLREGEPASPSRRDEATPGAATVAPQLEGEREALLASMHRARSVDVALPAETLMTFAMGWEMVVFGRVVAIDGPMVAIEPEPWPAKFGQYTVDDLAVFCVQTPDCGTSRDASGAVLVVVGRHRGLLLCRELEPWPLRASHRSRSAITSRSTVPRPAIGNVCAPTGTSRRRHGSKCCAAGTDGAGRGTTQPGACSPTRRRRGLAADRVVPLPPGADVDCGA
jgi:hypothetical protein